MSDDHPYATTPAARLLSAALRRKADEERVSVRTIGKALGYKHAVVLSHMANGRVPIPVDRAPEIARAIGLPEREFLLAVLCQRHKDVDWSLITSGSDEFADELEAIGGIPLSTFSAEHRRVMREVVADPRPQRRWLTLAELPLVEAIRDAAPRLRSEGVPRRLIDKLATTLRAE